MISVLVGDCVVSAGLIRDQLELKHRVNFSFSLGMFTDGCRWWPVSELISLPCVSRGSWWLSRRTEVCLRTLWVWGLWAVSLMRRALWDPTLRSTASPTRDKLTSMDSSEEASSIHPKRKCIPSDPVYVAWFSVIEVTWRSVEQKILRVWTLMGVWVVEKHVKVT